jgi:hypothetical protein
MTEPLENVTVIPDETNTQKWTVEIRGPVRLALPPILINEGLIKRLLVHTQVENSLWRSNSHWITHSELLK